MEVLYKDESFRIIGAAMHVYNHLGYGFLEPVYQEALEIEFIKRKIPYKREVELEIYYDGILLSKKYRVDFLCYDNILVEVKAVSHLDDGNRAQVKNYLKASSLRLGLLINFGNSEGLENERRLN